jgi:5'-nucleotidase (lipoprotein e(P4) family)
MEAIYLQCYNWASRVLEEQLQSPYELPPAVILDIDETVLDNSPQTVRQILDRTGFSEAMWDEWCSLAKAEALPGALEFTRLADSLGAEVFYISNRGEHLLNVTLKNLDTLGFPSADEDHVLLKTGTSSKDHRRTLVSDRFDIILMVGDNLGDFAGVFDNRSQDNMQEAIKLNRKMFGSRFIVLPNPMYGGWEKPYRAESQSESLGLKRKSLVSE